MSEKKPNEEQIKRAKKWLVEVLTDNTGLKDGNDDIFTGNRQTMFLLGDVRKETHQKNIDFLPIRLKELKDFVNSNPTLSRSADTSIVIAGSLRKNINIASDFFSAYDIDNNTTTITGTIAGKDTTSRGAIIIDLAQDGLVGKLEKIFRDQCIPNKQSVLRDPDGTVIDKRVAKEAVRKQSKKLITFARNHGIGETALLEIIKEECSRSRNKERNQ